MRCLASSRSAWAHRPSLPRSRAARQDEVVFGVDLDDSALAVKDVRRSRHFAQACGQTTRQQADNFERSHFMAPPRAVRAPPPPLEEAPAWGAFRTTFQLDAVEEPAPAPRRGGGAAPASRKPFGARRALPPSVRPGRAEVDASLANILAKEQAKREWMEARSASYFAPLSLQVGNVHRRRPQHDASTQRAARHMLPL